MSRLLKCQIEPLVRAFLSALMLICPGILRAQSSPAPSIINQPQSQFVLAGDTAIFSVTASGSQPLFYRWFGPQGGIADATNATLKLTRVDLSDQGNYFVKVANSFGMTQSMDAVLTVMRVDFGDAPVSYGTRLAENGAQHMVVQGMQLGANITFEPDGQPDPAANADIGDDGVQFLTPL